MITSGPAIYLISRPNIDIEDVERFLKDRSLKWKRTNCSSNAEEIVEVAGRICYLSFTDDENRITFPNDRYISNLISKGHHSVLEHATWTFIIDRVSRAFTHQLVRHRIGFSFSQLSQQYHDESEADVVIPPGLSEHPELLEQWYTAIKAAQDAYRCLLDNLASSDHPETKRWLRSTARSVLSNATETAIAVTANARAIRHFFLSVAQLLVILRCVK